MRIVVAHQDIHEQKQAELQLREAETFTKSIVDNLPNMIFVKEAQSLRFVQINKAGEHLLGITRQDLLGNRTLISSQPRKLNSSPRKTARC